MFSAWLAEMPRLFSWYNLLLLGQGLAATLLLAVAGCLIGLVAGFALAALRCTQGPLLAPLRGFAYGYCFLFRRIPFLVTLMLVFFISQASRLALSTLSIALVSVCLIAAAYLGEIIRGGLQAVHRNQWEAAQTLNFSYVQTLRLVIVPQAWVVMLPPTFSFFVMFIKDTALASQISVLELTYVGKVLANKGFSAGLVYGVILLLYFLISYPLTRFGQRLEKQLAATRRR